MSLSPRIQPSTWRPQPELGWNLGFPYTRVPEAGAQWTAVYVALRRELAAHALLDRPMGPWMQRQAANLRRARENRARRGIPEDRCSAPARTLPFGLPVNRVTPAHAFGGRR